MVRGLLTRDIGSHSMSSIASTTSLARELSSTSSFQFLGNLDIAKTEFFISELSLLYRVSKGLLIARVLPRGLIHRSVCMIYH